MTTSVVLEVLGGPAQYNIKNEVGLIRVAIVHRFSLLVVGTKVFRDMISKGSV